jgi:predicted metal-binding membrane protein
MTPAGDSALVRGSGSYERVKPLAPAALLLLLAGGCWAVTVHRMRGMDMGPGTDLGGLGWFAVVWLTMMAAMMLPSLAPMASAHAARSRLAGTRRPWFGAGLFTAGYLLTWLGAGVLAYAAVKAVGSLDLGWLAWDRAGPYVAGGVILAAAAYELTPMKARCLGHCRRPELLAGRWRAGSPGATVTGLEHGAFCVGASWALMAVLFAVGVMNVTWMLVVAGLVALEKLFPRPGLAVALTALLVAALALGVAFAPAQVPWLTVPM